MSDLKVFITANDLRFGCSVLMEMRARGADVSPPTLPYPNPPPTTYLSLFPSSNKLNNLLISVSYAAARVLRPQLLSLFVTYCYLVRGAFMG